MILFFGLKHGDESLNDATPLLPKFEEHVKALLTEMFDPAVPFDQTTDEKVCRLCPYQQLCYR